MTLSRTARILIAVLLLAAAAFFWVNFFSREQSSPAPTVTATAPRAPKAANGAAKATAGTAKPTTGTATPTTGASKAGTEAAKPATGAQATAKGAEKAPVVVPSHPAVATHDLQVAELPFLVTQPPQPNTSETGGNTSQATATATNQVAASAKRMTVNPFSPILIRAPQARSAPTPPPRQTVVTQKAPAPKVEKPLAQAPTPQPIAPPPPQASNLPGALPSGMLPTTPSVLQSTRAQVQAQTKPPAPTPAPENLGTVAAVREPGSGTAAQLGNLNNPDTLSVAPTVPGLLGPGQPTKPAAPTTTTAAANGNGKAPLQAGTDSLSLYLRDHNVRFTGTVLGPISVGVFRSDLYKAPVVVSLGQDLPETKITLTDLRGHEAVFTYQDSTQSLSLDLRR
jgi:hypothetical protein